MKKLILFLSVILLFSFYGCSANESSESQTLDFQDLYVSDRTQEEESVPTTEPEETAHVLTKKYVKSKSSSLNVRSGPSLTAEVIGTLDEGDMVAYYGEEGEWYRTLYRGNKAYVSVRYTTLTEMSVQDERTESVIALGERYLGTPYVYGATRLHDGYGNKLKGFTTDEFDCSSLMQYIFYYGAEVVLQSTTRTQVAQGTSVEKEDIRRGDLLFMTNSSRKNNTGTERIGHVAMYLGDNYILHTASDHAVIEKMTASRWDNYITARRML